MPRKRKPIQPMKYPVGHEYAYRTSLLSMNKELKLQLKKYLSPIVPEMVAEVTAVHLPTGQIRQDAWQDRLTGTMRRIARNMIPPVNKTIKHMKTIGPKVNQYNKDEWRKLIRSQYGVNPVNEDPERWTTTLDRWANNNSLLIEDIPRKQLTQIADLTVQTLRSGKPARDMADDIYTLMGDRTDVGDSRAKLIARDQVAKLNGEFTRERQTDAGVDSYTWRTVGDERVREAHAEVDGQVFAWGSPPGETDFNEPGEDYQCRCWAEPVLPETMDIQASLLEEADMEDA